MKLENLKTSYEIERYIEELINKFVADIINKDEMIIAIAELVFHLQKTSLESVFNAYKLATKN